MTDLTTCFECDARVPVDQWRQHECPPQPLPDPLDTNPYDLDRWDIWESVDDDEEERDR
jgi:hypothetical protein